jgi:hypothetical protein
LSKDPQNCGSCRTSCTRPNAKTTCSNGRCMLQNCLSPFQDCNDDESDGCEADTSSNRAHCSGSNKACRFLNVVSTTCSSSKCSWQRCAPGFDNCDGNRDSGCETVLVGSSAVAASPQHSTVELRQCLADVICTCSCIETSAYTPLVLYASQLRVPGTVPAVHFPSLPG